MARYFESQEIYYFLVNLMMILKMLTDCTNTDPPKGQMGYHPTDIDLTHLC